MDTQFNRTKLLLGSQNFNLLQKANIIIVGIGAVGSVTAEILVRTGVKNITLIDHDKVDITNINRQLIATHSTLNKPKVDVAKLRLLDINPNLNINTYQTFINADNCPSLIHPQNTDLLIDCIDSLTAKIQLIKYCLDKNVKIISSMGAARKSDPTHIKIDKIQNTSHCPLAKQIRKHIKHHPNINNYITVFSTEQPCPHFQNDQSTDTALSNIKVLPSLMTVTTTFGACIASKALDILTKNDFE